MIVSPFRQLHEEGARFRRLVRQRPIEPVPLYGDHGTAVPRLAFQADMDPGVSRHTISQMVVAGTISYFPWPPEPTPSEGKSHA